MDVRCERCKTEYEFDDERITEAGVTVKCTTCGHVFKVKKKALVVTVPVKPGESSGAASLGGDPGGAQAEKPREWRVKQANGNVFTFKELTTLQKWIVERKVSRDDEISLTGENWKRLGNIAELASFFQVVEDAQKAAQLQALQQQAILNPMLTPPGGSALPPIPGAGARPQPAPLPPVGAAPPAPAPPAPRPPPASPPPTPAARAVMNAARSPGQQPRFLSGSDDSSDPADDLAAAGLKKSGGAGKWVVAFLLLAALGAGGYYGWHQGYLDPLLAKLLPPPQDPAVAPPQALEPPTPALTQAPSPDGGADGGEVAAAAQAGDGGTKVAEAPGDAGAQVAHAAPDAGPAVADGAGETRPAAATKDPPPRRERPEDFDSLMARGDRLRLRERTEAALDAYGKASDLKPNRAEPWAGRGLALLDMGRTDAAESAFQQALKLNPRYAVAVMGMAEAQRKLGNREEAIRYYEKYLDILPDGREANVARSAIERLKE